MPDLGSIRRHAEAARRSRRLDTTRCRSWRSPADRRWPGGCCWSCSACWSPRVCWPGGSAPPGRGRRRRSISRRTRRPAATVDRLLARCRRRAACSSSRSAGSCSFTPRGRTTRSASCRPRARRSVETAFGVPPAAAGEGTRWRLEFLPYLTGEPRTDRWLAGAVGVRRDRPRGVDLSPRTDPTPLDRR